MRIEKMSFCLQDTYFFASSFAARFQLFDIRVNAKNIKKGNWKQQNAGNNK